MANPPLDVDSFIASDKRSGICSHAAGILLLTRVPYRLASCYLKAATADEAG